MARISQRRIQSFFDIADKADTRTAKGRGIKGRALEDLVCYLFELLPGIKLSKRNKLNQFVSEEIDVAFWNSKHSQGLYFLPDVIIVECKNWAVPVGSQEVSWFYNKLRDRRAFPYGILIAANGITGSAEDKTNAHQIIASALREGCQIIVITRQEIESLRDTKQLVEVIQEKLCELAVSGTLFI